MALSWFSCFSIWTLLEMRPLGGISHRSAQFGSAWPNLEWLGKNVESFWEPCKNRQHVGAYWFTLTLPQHNPLWGSKNSVPLARGMCHFIGFFGKDRRGWGQGTGYSNPQGIYAQKKISHSDQNCLNAPFSHVWPIPNNYPICFYLSSFVPHCVEENHSFMCKETKDFFIFLKSATWYKYLQTYKQIQVKCKPFTSLLNHKSTTVWNKMQTLNSITIIELNGIQSIQSRSS